MSKAMRALREFDHWSVRSRAAARRRARRRVVNPGARRPSHDRYERYRTAGIADLDPPFAFVDLGRLLGERPARTWSGRLLAARRLRLASKSVALPRACQALRAWRARAGGAE